eukprot:gb/GECH01006752.1/.p1 GENE.gb/GECH01006752.1/~~gb/GECH01006752.1/.p1  ORF type:complete len:102 (+),score=8.90 gb/GECH01006752.1/:1-306(+)
MIRSQLLSTHSHSFLQKRGSAHSSKNLFSRQQRTLFIFDLLSGKLNNPQYREKKINESEKKANERKKKLMPWKLKKQIPKYGAPKLCPNSPPDVEPPLSPT